MGVCRPSPGCGLARAGLVYRPIDPWTFRWGADLSPETEALCLDPSPRLRATQDDKWNVMMVVPSGCGWTSASPRARANRSEPPFTMPTVGFGNTGSASTESAPRPVNVKMPRQMFSGPIACVQVMLRSPTCVLFVRS